MVEYVEEGILRGRADELLDVIHDEDIDPHVESHEVRQLVLYVHGIDVLSLELIAGHIEDDHVRIGFVHCDADCLCQMGLSKSGTSEDEQRVERCLARLVGDVDAGVESHFVALPLHQILETVGRIEPRIDLQFLYPRENERTRIAGRLESVDGNRSVLRNVSVRGGKLHRRILAYRMNPVHESGLRAEHSPEG